MSASVHNPSAKRVVVTSDSEMVTSQPIKIPLIDDDKPTDSKKLRKEYSPEIKVIACLGLVTVQVFAAIVMKIAQKDGKYSFSPQSSLVMSETIKTAISIAYLFMEASPTSALPSSTEAHKNKNIKGMIIEQSSQALIIHMFGLAALYCFNNGIMFWLFARADPGSISLIKSGATIVSAVLMYFWRHFKLSIPRWLVIIIQMLGLVVAQYDACKGQSVLSPTVYLVLFISLFNSSIANVWNEHVIKNFNFAGLAVKNIYLYAFGAILNMVAFMYYRIAIPETPQFFEGYGFAAMGVVTSNACIGIAMNAVYKYADALVKNVSTTTTTVVLLIVSSMFFAGRSDIMVFIGTVVVICGTFLYFLLGISETKINELEKKLMDTSAEE